MLHGSAGLHEPPVSTWQEDMWAWDGTGTETAFQKSTWLLYYPVTSELQHRSTRKVNSHLSIRKIQQFYRRITYKATTFPSEHSTPNHEHGSITPTSTFQFERAPNGSLTTLSLNLNSTKPAQKWSVADPGFYCTGIKPSSIYNT